MKISADGEIVLTLLSIDRTFPDRTIPDGISRVLQRRIPLYSEEIRQFAMPIRSPPISAGIRPVHMDTVAGNCP